MTNSSSNVIYCSVVWLVWGLRAYPFQMHTHWWTIILFLRAIKFSRLFPALDEGWNGVVHCFAQETDGHTSSIIISVFECTHICTLMFLLSLAHSCPICFIDRRCTLFHYSTYSFRHMFCIVLFVALFLPLQVRGPLHPGSIGCTLCKCVCHCDVRLFFYISVGFA
jgi:hypothetical protein